MKKIFTLLVALFCFGFAANAQSADLELLNTLRTTDTIYYNNTGQFGRIMVSVFINHGPSALAATDTLKWRSVSYGGTISLILPSTGMRVNDTLSFRDTIAILPSQAPVSNPITWCDSLWAKSGTTGAVIPDPVLSNNKVCKTVSFLHATGVKSVTLGNESVSIYPNPASNNLNVEYVFDNNEAATIEIRDLMGKSVLTQSLGKNLIGRKKYSVDISSLSNGIYTVEINATKGRVMTKLVVQK